MTGGEGAKLSTAVVVATGIPSLAMSSDEMVLLVVMPIVAAWVGLAGIGLLEGATLRRILTNLLGSMLLGGVSGIVALSVIEFTKPPAYMAMLISLISGMGAITIARRLSASGGKLVDFMLSGFGLRRIDDKDKRGDE